MRNQSPNKGTPAPAEIRDRLRALYDEQGERRVIEATGINKGTLGRLLAGLPCQRGTLALAREGIAALDAKVSR